MRITWRDALAALVVVLAVAAVVPQSASGASGWAPTGSMAAARARHVAVKLHDGRVLAISGSASSGQVSTAERYDPTTGTWSAAGSVAVPRQSATATLLADGRVLLVGGISGSSAVASSEIYDPATSSWSPGGSLHTAREGHVAVRLVDGRVLVAGGATTAGSGLASSELYDPATNTWSVTGAMASGRQTPHAALLPDGRVLVAGGNDQSTYYATAEVFDPMSGTWSPTASLHSVRSRGAVATLDDGDVLVAGGSRGLGFVLDFERYDVATGTWSQAPGAPNGIFWLAARLESGGVLLSTDQTPTTPVFLPASGTVVTPTSTLSTARGIPSLTRLDDGRVLIAGGVGRATAELYTPPTTRGPARVDLEATRVGQASEQDVTVTNTGNERLHVRGVSVSGAGAGDFAVVGGTCVGAVVAPAASCVVRVRFAPSATGARSAVLTFDDNAESSVTELGGTALARAVDPPPAPREEPRPEPAPSPTPPAPATARTTDADRVIACSGTVSIISMSGSGRDVTVGGLALSRLAGQSVTVWLRTRKVGSTVVGPDGAFSVRVRLPATRGRVRLVAKVAGRSSAAFATDRRLEVVVRRRVGDRVRLTAKVAGGVAGSRVTIRRQTGCGRTSSFATARLDRNLRFTTTLPLATAEEGVVLYRAVAAIRGGSTFTLPIAVTPRG